jgi:hypothetical protein
MNDDRTHWLVTTAYLHAGDLSYITETTTDHPCDYLTMARTQEHEAGRNGSWSLVFAMQVTAQQAEELENT